MSKARFFLLLGKRAFSFFQKLPVYVCIFLLKGYRWCVSPFFGQCCRFSPSCSLYAIEALQKKGFWRGAFLSLRRVLRCHPGAPGGSDPV